MRFVRIQHYLDFDFPDSTPAELYLGKVFQTQEGHSAALAIDDTTPIKGRNVVIIDHPPTAGLVALVQALESGGATVHLRDHHADADRDGSNVAAVRALLGERAVVKTREEHPACSSLVEKGEFAYAIVIADADQDGLTAALKAIGVTYPQLDEDAAVLDGPIAGKTVEALSPLGFRLVRAWGALPPFGAPNRDEVLGLIAFAFAQTVNGDEEQGGRMLNEYAQEYECRVEVARELALRIEDLAPGVRSLDVRGASAYDQPTLTSLLDQGALVTVLIKSDGPIGKLAGAQVSLARTKLGETAWIDLAKLVPSDWPRGLEAGVISNTPFLLHLSPARWEEFKPILFTAVAALQG